MNDKVIQFPVVLDEHNLIPGQYVHVEDDDEGGYRQGVITAVFDDFVLIKYKSGTILRYHFDGDDRYSIVVPTKDGKRVMAKKKLFGGYTTEPDMR